MTQTQMIVALADKCEMPKKTAKATMDHLGLTAVSEVKKNGLFVLPGFAKFVVVKRPARPARKGINPFTKEPTTFAAKPASKAVKARPINGNSVIWRPPTTLLNCMSVVLTCTAFA